MLHLLNENGYLYNYTEFLQKYTFPITPRDFAIIFDAIPAELLMLLRGASSLKTNVHFESNLMLEGINLIDKKCTNSHLRKLLQEPVISSANIFGTQNSQI